MNPFEIANLKRLSATSDALRGIGEIIATDRRKRLKDSLESSVRLIVRLNFEIHEGDLNKIKEAIRGDAEIITGLNLEKIINDEYKRQSEPKRLQARYGKEIQRKVWSTILRLEREHSERISNGAAREGDTGIDIAES